MTPRYIIHIGPMKTASTYLQQCLTDSRQELLRDGICYPEEFLAENNRFMHIPVFYALLRKRPEPLREAFARLNTQGHKTIVLSCEHFHFLPPEALASLRELTGATDFQVIYTARRWSDRIGSLWNHALFMGSRLSLPEFYLSMMAGEALHHYPKWLRDSGEAVDMDYSITWKLIADTFGRDAIGIFPYSAIMDRGWDVFDVFCRDVLGLAQAPSTALAGTRRWASMSTATQEIARVLNEMHYNATADDSGVMPARFMRGRKKFDSGRIAAAIDAETTKLKLDDRLPLFDAAFDNMSRYTDRVIGGGELFKRGAKSVPYVRPGYMLAPGVREDFKAIYGQIAASVAAETKKPGKEAASF